MSASDGTAKKNLSNTGAGVDEFFSDFSPDGQKIVYTSEGVQTSNPQGDRELYVMNALDGSANKNLTNNNARDYEPEWGR
jgi:Tol biopolymer transport system component